MCGIAGFWTPFERPHVEVLRAMTGAVAHRGPDGDGFWIEEDCGIAFGHRRLAIVELSELGHQPMPSASGRFMMTFNGEIYNFRRLRAELEARGRHFCGGSDTEVVLGAFEEWGIAAALGRFVGMFAIAVWDSHTESLTLTRDRIGEKPLYVFAGQQQVLFGSELKALRAHPAAPSDVDPNALASLLRFGYVPSPLSIFRDIEKVPTGTAIVFTRQGQELTSRRYQYWSAGSAIQTAVQARTSVGFAEATDRVETALDAAVVDQMVADVPVGAFLSGGIDSSLIVALMQRHAPGNVRTFTVAFEDRARDESPYARAIASHLGTTHTQIEMDSSEALRLIGRLPTLYDEPFADSSQLPTWLVSKATRQHVTVALSGDGGDELFAGYPQYVNVDSIAAGSRRVPEALRPFAGLAIASLPESIIRSLARSTWAPEFRTRVARALTNASNSRVLYEDRQALWTDPRRLLKQPWRTQVAEIPTQAGQWLDFLTAAEAQMAYDSTTYLPDDILVKVDRASMAVGLETRAPFLDHRVLETAWNLPLEHKIQSGRGKRVLKNLLQRFVPEHLFERPKQGFSIPLDRWLREDLKAWGAELLDWSTSPDCPIDPSLPTRAWKEHQDGRVNHSARLWPVLVSMQWLRGQ